MEGHDTSATYASPRVAVIDIGTNTLLLLVAEAGPGGALRSVHDACRFGRLGQGLDRTGVLDAAAVERSLEILREYRSIIDAQGVDTVAAVGTQALREARNAETFLTPAADILGVPVQVIAGLREAELVYRAVAASLDVTRSQWARDGSFVVADVGGGSTEIIVAAQGQVQSFTSVPLGSVRMTERYLHSDPPAPGEVAAMIAGIDEVLGTLALPDGVGVVGTAGTATTIASVELGLMTYDADRVHDLAVPTAAVDRQLERYLALPLAERRAVPGLEPERADLIAAGLAIFARLLHRVQATEILISERGVRWGLAHELVSGLAAPARAPRAPEDEPQ